MSNLFSKLFSPEWAKYHADRYKKNFGVEPNLFYPRTFTEKILVRKCSS